MRLDRSVDWMLLLASLAGLVLALLAYSTPESGVSGTGGALLICFASAALLVAAAIYLSRPSLPNWLWRLLEVLTVVGALGSAFAGYMLMQPWFTGVMLVVLIASLGHFVTTTRPAP